MRCSSEIRSQFSQSAVKAMLSASCKLGVVVALSLTAVTGTFAQESGLPAMIQGASAPDEGTSMRIQRPVNAVGIPDTVNVREAGSAPAFPQATRHSQLGNGAEYLPMPNEDRQTSKRNRSGAPSPVSNSNGYSKPSNGSGAPGSSRIASFSGSSIAPTPQAPAQLLQQTDGLHKPDKFADNPSLDQDGVRHFSNGKHFDLSKQSIADAIASAKQQNSDFNMDPGPKKNRNLNQANNFDNNQLMRGRNRRRARMQGGYPDGFGGGGNFGGPNQSFNGQNNFGGGPGYGGGRNGYGGGPNGYGAGPNGYGGGSNGYGAGPNGYGGGPNGYDGGPNGYPEPRGRSFAQNNYGGPPSYLNQQYP